MKLPKKRKVFLSVLCAVSLLLAVCSIPTFAVTANAVTATTGTTVKQGASEYCYVYIDSTESMAALDVTVHFDNTKVKINDVYNSISCRMYDSVVNLSDIRFSYLFDDTGTTSKTQLFYFTYQVLSTADLGKAYFDITIGEAYDHDLNDVSVSGSKCSFTIEKKAASKSCNMSGVQSVDTSVDKEFTLNYRFGTNQIASGSAVINYDPDLFQVVSVTNGAILNDKVVDINTNSVGAIYLSFAGTAYNNNYDLVSVTFKTLKNVTENAQIKLNVTDLLDLDRNPISCSGYTTKANITFDSAYTADAPAMSLDGIFSYAKKQITLSVSLEEQSKLGAGDFTIAFDPELVTYHSSAKEFKPTYFNVNEKKVKEGKLIFSIISTEDIVSSEKVLTVVFDMKTPYSGKTAEFDLSGKNVVDSMTEPILLNYVDASVLLEYQITFRYEDGTVIQQELLHHGNKVTAPRNPAVPEDLRESHEFAGWDKTVTDCQGDATYTAVFTEKYILGDFDENTVVDNKDVEYLLWHTLFPENYPANQNADLDKNGTVDNKDVEYLLWHTLFPDEYPIS